MSCPALSPAPTPAERRHLSSFDLYCLIGASACAGGAIVGALSALRGRNVSKLAREIQRDMRGVLSGHAAQQARIGHEFRNGLRGDLIGTNQAKEVAVSMLDTSSTAYMEPIVKVTAKAKEPNATSAPEPDPPTLPQDRGDQAEATPTLSPPTLTEISRRLDEVGKEQSSGSDCTMEMLSELDDRVAEIKVALGAQPESRWEENPPQLPVIPVLIQDSFTNQQERLEQVLTSIKALTKESQTRQTRNGQVMQAIHDQLGVLKDSVFSIESRLTSLSKEIAEQKAAPPAETPKAKSEGMYGLFHDMFTNSDGEGGTNEAGRITKVKPPGKKVGGKRHKATGTGPIPMYTADGTLEGGEEAGAAPSTAPVPEEIDLADKADVAETLTTDELEAPSSEPSLLDAIAQGIRDRVTPSPGPGKSNFETARPASANGEVAPGADARAWVGPKAKPSEEQPLAPSVPKAEPTKASDAASDAPTFTQVSDAETAAAIDDLHDLLNGPVKRYGMVGPEEKERIYTQ